MNIFKEASKECMEEWNKLTEEEKEQYRDYYRYYHFCKTDDEMFKRMKIDYFATKYKIYEYMINVNVMKKILKKMN